MAFLYGKDTAERLQKVLKGSVEHLIHTNNVTPTLAVVQVGDSPLKSLYVKQLHRGCDSTGIAMVHSNIDCSNGVLAAQKLEEAIRVLNKDPSVHGIMLLRHFPKNFYGTFNEYVNKINIEKDVEHLTVVPIGNANSYIGNHVLTISPPVVTGAGFLADMNNIRFEYQHCVIVGCSGTVGRPLAAYLLFRGATVTLCHEMTRDLDEHLQRADVLFAAAGCKHLITPDKLENGTVVFDIGMTMDEKGNIYGDVHPDVAQYCTLIPSPGGVGPMNVAMVMQNVLEAARYAVSKS